MAYEDNNTYEDILERSLARVSTDVNKVEGSIVFNGVAPASEELAEMYVNLDAVVENGFADTAEREFLIKRCAERGISPYPATYSTVKGKFNMEIPIGNRFNYDELNFTTKEFIESAEESGVTYYYYQLQCEEAGTEGNLTSGELSAIDFVDNDMVGEIVALLIPAEDEEDTEDLRARYLGSFTATAFGGNRADYYEKTMAIGGVGGVKVYPVWDGGGTVKLYIIDSNYDPASSTLVALVQNTIDPTQDGTGQGTAPIGHEVTVESATGVTVNITTRATLEEGFTWEGILSDVTDAVEAYFLEMRKAWDNSDGDISNYLTVRISQIENRILNVDGVVDVQDTTVNSSTGNLILQSEEIPVLGGITNVD